MVDIAGVVSCPEGVGFSFLDAGRSCRFEAGNGFLDRPHGGLQLSHN